ncbi:MAG: hypothetical protein HQ476_04730 [SAR202 cluster bacterium]|nr:hypothetical protein [SAR202 cluster bacterium]
MRKILVLLVGFTLLGSSLYIPANAAVKAGAKCKIVGQTKVKKDKEFICISKGKKFVWSKGMRFAVKATPTPTPTPVLTPISTSPTTDFEPISICKLSKPANLPMNDGERGSVGFPRDSDAISSEGSHKALLLLVDFPDAIADATLASTFKERILLVDNFFAESSYNKFKLTVEPTTKVYRLQNTSTFYGLLEAAEGGPIAGSTPKLQDLLLDSMAAADKDIDFSKYLFITIAAPLSKTLTLSGAFGLSPRSTEKFDGVKYNFASFSPLDSVLPVSQYNKIWNWTHDIAHMLGLMHPFEREDRNAWDIMFNFAPQPDFMGWNKWKLNWITDDQVYCLRNSMDKKILTLLSPVGVASQLKKMLVIQSNLAYALVIEVRRETSFDRSSFLKEQGGVIVYRVDTTKQGNTGSPKAGPFKILSNLQKKITYVSNDLNQIPYTIGTMKQGESIEIEGVRIEVLQSTAEGDYVSVSKVNG